ncbi:N-6 DNA methylase [Candidatus Woesearchaeota archaeon]|nr:N-6 DNA methylase [Candidatus Woesearchaeota archaeon]
MVLSDFEGIIVFNALLKLKKERISERTVLKLKYTEYLDKIDDLWLLSKESFFGDKLNKHAESIGHITNKVPVNELLLSKLLIWRNALINKIAGDNEGLSKEDVAECVQRLLNRLIFIRTCEDRGIESEKNLLRNLTKEWQGGDKRLDKMLQDVFRNFDEGYDSSLFERHLVDNIKVNSDLLYDVISGLYEDIKEDVEFDFAVIDADILGSIYEQYLGTIQKGEGGKDKEKRKSHGIYYTPKYIVDYIVTNTLGKILEEAIRDKDYAKIGKLKVLDPACGSGSFLLKALEMFDDAYGKTPDFAKFPKGRKIKTLCNNIYGVDLDSEAVELTKLNLLLSSTYSRKKLPNLNHNIECGNSLIDDPQVAGDKAFDWNKRFKDVMDKGGFDVIIGNPPYIGFHGFKNEKGYFAKRFQSAKGKYDIYIPFIEKSIELLKDGGIMAFICPSAFMKRDYGDAIRKYILENAKILEIVDFQHEKIFGDALNYTCIIIFQKAKDISGYRIMIRESKLEGVPFTIKQEDIDNNPWVFSKQEELGLIKKIDRHPHLEEVADISEGIVTGNNEVFLLKKSDHYGVEPGLLFDAIRGNEVRRYFMEPHEYSLVYPYYIKNNKTLVIKEADFKKEYPKAFKYLQDNRSKLSGRRYFEKSSKVWYELWNQRNMSELSRIKIVTPELSDSNRFSIAPAEAFPTDTVCYIIPKKIFGCDAHYLLAIMNSRLIEYYYKKRTVPKASGFYIYKVMYLKGVPIKVIDFADSNEKKIHAGIVKLVNNMLDLNQQFANVKDKQTSETERLKRQIEETDRGIDELVYKLYGLTEEEIGVVEESTKGGSRE